LVIICLGAAVMIDYGRQELEISLAGFEGSEDGSRTHT
jgi:hypothetical protein